MYIACQSSRCGLILHNLVADYQTARVAATFFDTWIISWKAKSIGKNVIDVLGVIDWVYAKLMRINVMLFQSDMIWKIIGVRYRTWVYNFRESDGTEVAKTYNICGSYLFWNLIMIGEEGEGAQTWMPIISWPVVSTPDLTTWRALPKAWDLRRSLQTQIQTSIINTHHHDTRVMYAYVCGRYFGD